MTKAGSSLVSGDTLGGSTYFAFDAPTTSFTGESAAQLAAPFAFKVKNLFVFVQSGPTSGAAVFTFRLNGVNTALTVTVSSGAADGSTWSDKTNIVSVAQGDKINWAKTGAGAGNGFGFMAEVVTPDPSPSTVVNCQPGNCGPIVVAPPIQVNATTPIALPPVPGLTPEQSNLAWALLLLLLIITGVYLFQKKNRDKVESELKGRNPSSSPLKGLRGYWKGREVSGD